MKHLKTVQLHSVAGTVLALGVLSLFLACQAPNPLTEQGPASFAALYAASQGKYREGYFVIEAPGGRNYVAISSDFSVKDDVLLGLDLSDFMQAGFDPQSLNPDHFAPVFFVYDLPTSTMVLSSHLTDSPFDYQRYLDANGKALTLPTPATVYAEFLRNNPDKLAFTAANQVFHMNFGAGLSLEWPLIPQGSIQEVALVLDPAPLIAAGLQLDRLKKWKVATVDGTDTAGKASSLTRLRLSFKLP